MFLDNHFLNRRGAKRREITYFIMIFVLSVYSQRHTNIIIFSLVAQINYKENNHIKKIVKKFAGSKKSITFAFPTRK